MRARHKKSTRKGMPKVPLPTKKDTRLGVRIGVGLANISRGVNKLSTDIKRVQEQQRKKDLSRINSQIEVEKKRGELERKRAELRRLKEERAPFF